MNLTMYTYGYSDTIYHILQAIAMIRESGFYMALIQFVSIVTVFSYAVKGAFFAASSGYKQFLMKGLGLILIIQLLLLPKASMLIEDKLEHKISKVDNIPIAFALPVGVIESIGMVLSSVFELAFAPIEVLSSGGMTQSSYYKYGSVFSASLKKELSQARIKDPEFLENMRNFHKRCIILPAMIGYQFTPQELMTSKNVWKLVKDKAGTLTRIDMRVGKARTTMNCKEAADVFENYFNDEIVTIVNKNINKVFGRATNSNLDTSRATAVQLSEVFFSNIKANYSEIRPAQETLKQHMMINFMNDHAANSAYGLARARMQQESGSLISSNLAQTMLPISLVLFKCIVSAIFIFVIPVMLLPGGMKSFTTYLKIFISLQLWPALNSILNMIMVMHSNLTPGNNSIVSFSTASTVANNMDTIVTIAGGLQPLIPVIAYYIISSSSNAMANLAGSLSGSINSAANMAAGEVTTGNRSFDNINEGNLTKNMRNANKTDYNQSYVSGEIRQQLSDGTAKTTHADGTNTYIAPEPQANYNLSTATQSHVSQGLTNSVSEHDQNQRTYSEAQSNTMAKSTAYLANLIERQHAGETLGFNENTKEGRDMSKIVEAGVKEYEKNGYDKTQAASTTLKGGMHGEATWGGKGGSGKGEGGEDGGLLGMAKRYAVGKIAGALLPDDVSGKVYATLEGDASAKSQSDQGIGEEGHHSEAVNIKRNLETLQNADKGETWGKEHSDDQTKAREVRAAYEEQTRAEESVTKSAQKVKDWQQAVQQSSTVTATSDKNMRHQLINQLTKEGWGRDSAAQMVNNGHPEAQRAFNKIAAAQVSKVNAQINQGRQDLSPENLQQRLDQTGEQNTSKITTNPDTLIDPKDNPTTANFNKIPKQIEEQKNTLGNNFNDKQTEADGKIIAAELGIDQAAKPLKDEISHEDDKSFRNNKGKPLNLGRQNPQRITSEALNNIGGGSSTQFTANPRDFAVPENVSVTSGKGIGQESVSLGVSNNSATDLPATQDEQTLSHISPQGVKGRGKGGSNFVSGSQKRSANTVISVDPEAAEAPVSVSNSNAGINRPKPSLATNSGGEESGASNSSSSAQEVQQEAGSGSNKQQDRVDSNKDSNNQDAFAPKKPTEVNLSNLQVASTGNEQQSESTQNPTAQQPSATNSTRSGSKDQVASSNEAVQPKTDSSDSKAWQEGDNRSKKKQDRVDSNKDSNNQDAFAPKKPTEVNLSTLQKAERKNK